MSDSHKNKKIMDRIFKKRGKKFCCYCHERVYRSNDIRPAPPDMATIDHIFSRLDIRRYLITNSKNTVLSCHKCNNMRNELERDQIVLDYLSYGLIHTVMTNVGLEIIPEFKIKI